MLLRGTTLRLQISLLVAMLLLPVVVRAETEQSWRWDGVPRVVAVGDIHGAHDRLVGILTQTGVIDAQGNWAGGRAHLVSVGDVLDRGPDSRKVLDLFMHLEPQAARSGGKVHLVLGNHEVMNLVGDRRYVSIDEYRAFADEENPADRERTWQRFQQLEGGDDSPDALRATFDERYPPGFFGLLAAFSVDGVYGSWLLQRNVLVRIDGTVFVHGGLSRAIGGMDGDELNKVALDQLGAYLAMVDRFVELGVLTPETDYGERAELVQRAIDTQGGGSPSLPGLQSGNELRDLGRRFLELSKQALVFSREGPLWYRGTAEGSEESEQPVLDSSLAALGAERVAIGHTPTADGRIHVRLAGRALLIDAGMLEQVYQGHAAVLIQEGPRISAYYPAEDLTQDLPAATGVPRPADAPIARPTDSELEDFLLTATIVNVEDVGSGVTHPLRVTLEQDGVTRRAVFKSADTFIGSVTDPRSLASINLTDRWTYDIAAYRVDRLLGLNMVPVAVRRNVQGTEGALQVWVEDAIDEKERRESGLGQTHQDRIDRQLASMFVFDTLIYNEDRHAANILYTPSDWQIHLIDHTRAFRTKTNRPESLRTVTLAPTPELAESIADLDEKALREAMDGLMHPMQVTSILKRKKKLVAEWTEVGILDQAAVVEGR